MSVAAAGAGLILTILTLLGVPLTGFLAGFGVALWLAFEQGSAVWASVAIAVGILSEAFAGGYSSRGRGSLAQALGIVVFVRVLGPLLGPGLWAVSAESHRLAAGLRQTAIARSLRLLGVLVALALLAIASRG